jgi:hypothetical protein
MVGLIWLPALVFEVTLGLWLLIKGQLLVLPKEIKQ